MKIFGWIQCKSRNSNAGLLKESGNGNTWCLSLKPSWNNQHDYLRPKNGSKGNMQPEHGFGEATEEVFPGFLSIGTLNTESMASEPATPTFGFAADETPHEDKMEDVSYELELEKLFSVESEIEWFGESKRSSEEAKTLHPLEGYLFASSYELSASIEADTSLSVHVEKKKDDSILRKYKAAAHHMRRILQPCHKRNAVVGDGASTDSSSTRRKFRKIKQLFRRKVHPEELRAVKECKSHNKYKIKGNTDNHSHGNGGTTASREHFDGDGVWEELGQDTYQNAIMKARCAPLKKSNDKNVEHWIRSDADYLVLELGQK